MSDAWAERQNRDQILHIRVTPTERERLRSVALSHGMTEAAVIRQGLRLLTKDSQPRLETVTLRREVIE